MLSFLIVAIVSVGAHGPSDVAATSAAAHDLSAVLRARADTVVIEAGVEAAKQRLREGVVEPAALDFFARAEALRAAGRIALERVELKTALDDFDAAVASYRAEIARPGVLPLLAQTELSRGVTAFERKQVDVAQDAFRRARALIPAIELDAADVRPEVVRAFHRAVRDVPTAVLHVTADHGRAFVDGQPVQGDHALVALGAHAVWSVDEGFLPDVVWVDVAGPMDVHASSTIDPRWVALHALAAAPTAPALVILSQILRADEVWLVRANAFAIAVQKWRPDCATAATITHDIVRAPDALGTCEARPLTIMQTDVHAPAGANLAPSALVFAKPAAKKKPLWKRAWFWASVAGGAAVVTAVVLAATLATGSTSHTASANSAAFFGR